MKSPRRLMVNRDGHAEHVKRGSHCNAKECCMAPELQAMDYKDRLALKSDQFKHLVRAWDSSLLPRVKNCTPSESTFGYRHSAKLVFQIDPTTVRDPKPWLKIGIYRPDSHVVIDMSSCAIQTTPINQIIGYLNRNVVSAGLSIYNERTHTGLLRYVTFRQNKKGSQLLVTFVTNGKDDRNKLKTLARDLAAHHSFVRGVLQHINDIPGNAIFAGSKIESDTTDRGNSEASNTTLLTGVADLEESLNGIRFRISATSFFQVNPLVAETMYRRIAELAELRVGQTALDLYCGVGAIALHLAQSGARVMGIDEVSSSIQDAIANAKLNDLNASFQCGAVETVLPELTKSGVVGAVDVVTLNPSRGGCERTALDTVLNLRPQKIIYMSCNPATLLRDLDVLKSQYQVAVFEPFDMFPGTRHVEVLTLLTLR